MINEKSAKTSKEPEMIAALSKCEEVVGSIESNLDRLASKLDLAPVPCCEGRGELQGTLLQTRIARINDITSRLEYCLERITVIQNELSNL